MKNPYWKKSQRETYKLEAMAQDKGYPPLSRTVEVQIDVVDRANNPPVWDYTIYGPIYVKENMPVGGKVVSVKARSVIKHPKLNKRNNFLIFLIFFVTLAEVCWILWVSSIYWWWWNFLTSPPPKLKQHFLKILNSNFRCCYARLFN